MPNQPTPDDEVRSPAQTKADQSLEQLAGPKRRPDAREANPTRGDRDKLDYAVLASLIPTLTSPAGVSLAQAIVARLPPRDRALLERRAARRAAHCMDEEGPRLAQSRPASEARDVMLTGSLAELLVAAQALPPRAPASPLEAAFANELAPILLRLIGPDNRVRVEHTTHPHWRRVCALRITFPAGRSARGTGFLISPRVVATAGHCVYDKDFGGWAQSVEVIPGADGALRPFGSVVSREYRSVAGWVEHRLPGSDYACVVLPPRAFSAADLGVFEFVALEPPQLQGVPAAVAGYPVDKPFAELWGMEDRIKRVEERLLVYDMDTGGGQSGAPVYIRHEGRRMTVGIHSFGHRAEHASVRITPSIHRRLLRWAQIT
jgi:V8-like Glu-specific endopeptidase